MKYDQGDYIQYRNILKSTNWNSLLSSTDLESLAMDFNNVVIDAAKQCIPNKVISIRNSDVPWFNSKLRTLIRQRKRLHRRAKLLNTDHLWALFRTKRNEVTKAIKKAKTDFKNNIIEKINNNTINSKNWFKLTKSLLQKNKVTTIPTLIDGNIIASSDSEKVSLLNTFFCNQSSINDRNIDPPVLNGPPLQNIISSIVLTPQDIIDSLSHVDPNKATGPDLISPRLLKVATNELSVPLCSMFNLFLSNSFVPYIYKQGNVSPIFKKSDPSDPNNYRPISLLSCVGKLMERCIFKHIYNFIINNNILTKFQSGFIRGDSTTNQLLYIYNDFCKAIDEGKEVRVVFCDISKAFDRVWHRGLIHKLFQIGIRDDLLTWFKNYLTNRQQRVVLHNTNSDWKSLSAGVPQGSILGPLLFLIYINDIVNDISSEIRLFADDTSLYIIVDNPVASAAAINGDLRLIHTWSKTWLVDFNPTKTESLIISRKNIKPFHPDVSMNNVVIKNVDIHKHLGISFSNDAKWNSHIELTVSRAWKRIGLLRSLKFLLNRSCLEKLYISFIRPILEYSNSVWDNCSQEQKNDIESVQTEAARIVSGATKLCNIDNMYNDLKWESLSSRRSKHKLVIFYKMFHGLTPSYLSNLIPINNQNRYNLRNISNVPLIHARTQLYKNSFLPSVIRDWNNLPDNIRMLPTLSSFKHYLKSNIQKPPEYYKVGSRLGQIHHTRLRLNCSSLHFDLHRKNIIDDPHCSCGAIETTNHFLTECPNYTLQRGIYLSNLPCPMIINVLLYGSDRLSLRENCHIFLNVQQFIVASKRFEV